MSVAGETLLAVSLAGTLFFDVDPSEGRSKVLLGLMLTMAPFAVIAPLIAPTIDRVRGGNRSVIIASMLIRAGVASVMVVAIASDSLALFPEAFVMLVLAKTYAIAKAASVPHAVHGDAALVEANSKLQLLSGITGFVAGSIGAILLLVGAPASMALATLAFAGATVLALRIDPSGDDFSHVPRNEASRAAGRAELRSGAIVTAGTLMAVLRGSVGFVTLLLAFELRGAAERIPLAERAARAVATVAQDVDGYDITLVDNLDVPPTWHFGAILLASIIGGFAGAALAPRLRSMVPEERILQGSGVLVALAGLTTLALGGLWGEMVLAAGVTAAASSGKQAFDAIVQRDAPDADRGGLFARSETRFQIAWVVGALVPTAFYIPVPLGAFVVCLASLGGLLIYLGGGQRLAAIVQESRSQKSGTSAGSSSSGSS